MNEPAKPDYQKNIPLILLMNAVWMFMVLMPVIVPFFESRGLGMSGIYQLQAFFGAAVLILEVPSGYISDLLGRKNALIVAGIFHGLGFTAFKLAGGFGGLVAAELLLAVAVSLVSGTDVSLIYDSLEAAGSRKAPIKLLGRKMFYNQIGETAGALAGGWLVFWSLEANVTIQAVTAWLPIFAVMGIVEPPRKLMSRTHHRENIVYIYKSLFRHSRLLTLVLLNTIFYGVSTLIAVWAFQKDWQLRDIPLTTFGYLWAASSLAGAFTGRYAHKIEKRLGSVPTVALMALLPVLGYFGLAWTDALWGVGFCLTFQIARGINAVIMRDALNRRVGADMRATANSVASLGVRAVFLVMGPLAGYLIDTFGLKTALALHGGFFALCFFVLALPLISQKDSYQGAKK